MAFAAFAVTAPGIESVTATELGALGLTPTGEEPGGVSFAAAADTLPAALLHLRTATRLLVRVGEFRAITFGDLERRSRAIDWAAWLAPGAAFRLRVTCKKSRLYHSDAVAERVADAITGAVSGARFAGTAGADDAGEPPAQMFVVRLMRDECTISIDAAGEPLHKRGYRQAVAKAPLRETLAAAMLLGAGWDGTTALFDPMCGSGTLVIEGALIARHIAPGASRTFAAEHWPSADAAAWLRARAHAREAELPAAGVALCGRDRDAGAIAAARVNAERAGVQLDVDFQESALSHATAPAPRGLLVTNPPYGVRTGDAAELRDLYARLGRVARTVFPGWRAAILSADRSPGHALERQLGLSLAARWRTTNGGIPVRLLVGDIAPA